MGIAHNELQWGKILWLHLWIGDMYFFCKEVENCVEVILLCHGGE